MAKAVKRHWLSLLLIACLVLTAAAWLVLSPSLSLPAQAQSAAGGSQEQTEQPAPLSPYDHGRLQQLRNQLCLTNRDLAAMGCDQEQAEVVLEVMRNWYETNQARLAELQHTERAARQALRAALQEVAAGPTEERPEPPVHEIPALQKALFSAQRDQQTGSQSAVSAIEPLLSSSQREIWRTARKNIAAPARYRHVPDLEPNQVQALRDALDDSTALAVAENAILWSTQREKLASANVHVRDQLGVVTTAADTVAPQPTATSTLIAMDAPAMTSSPH